MYNDLSCDGIKERAIAYAEKKYRNGIAAMEGSESEEEQETIKARDPIAEAYERRKQARERMLYDRHQQVQARAEAKAAATAAKATAKKAAKKRDAAKWKTWLADVECAKQAETKQKMREAENSDYDELVLRDLV